jgi:DNA helicase II / ATP-dependent DNA helicase PcrA
MLKPDSLLKDLNPSQRQAVTHTGTPLLILAGAGSGKTRALTYRAAYLLLTDTRPENILLTTFTNKAAGEMQERLYQLAGVRLPLAGTFHSLCARLLRKYGPALNLNRDFIIFDPTDQLAALKQALRDLNQDPKKVRPNSMLYLIEAAKQELIGPQEYVQYARGETQELAAKVYPRYQHLLQQANALDFSDLLFKTVTLLQTSETVRTRLQNQLHHVLVDEYQDTNKAQYALTKLLAGKHLNVCVVGDASQAIYSWRGADYRNLTALKTDFPDLTTIKLEQNYRSSQNILDAAYGVIAHNSLHPVLSLWTDQSGGQQLKLFEAQDEHAEARYIVDAIRSSQKPLSHHAVLYRTNAQSRVLEEIFIREGIPYILVGGIKFYDRKEVKDVLAYIRYAVNQADFVSLRAHPKTGQTPSRFLYSIRRIPILFHSPTPKTLRPNPRKNRLLKPLRSKHPRRLLPHRKR